MNTLAAAALSNAKMRTQLGWPIALLTIALYAPVDGLPRLALVATGLFFLARHAPGTSRTPDKSRKAAPKPRPASRPTPKAPAAKPKPATKAARPRTARGRSAK